MSNTDIYKGYCCAAKYYFCHKNNFIETLKIIPRVIVYKNSLKVTEGYEQAIAIENLGMHARKIVFSTDSPVDTQIVVPTNHRDRYLMPDEKMIVSLEIHPKEKNHINRRRHVFIECHHPNVIIEVPIIVVENIRAASIPHSINFPRGVPKTEVFYELVIYNPTPDKKDFIARAPNKKLKVILSSNIVPRMDYTTILVALTVKDMTFIKDDIKLKFGSSKWQSITYSHFPIKCSSFIGVSHLHFEEQKYNHESKLQFVVCNESHDAASYDAKFLQRSVDMKFDGNNNELLNLGEVDSSHSLGSTTASVVTKDVLKYDYNAYRHFSMDIPMGTLIPKSANTFTITFKPVTDPECDFDDNRESPYLVRTKLIFRVVDELYTDYNSLDITGYIAGPDVEFTPTNFDFRKIYIGEEHCEQIKVLNAECESDARVHFKDYRGDDMVTIKVKPEEGYTLPPCSRAAFQLTMYSRVVGKFVATLRFKVKNGKLHTITVRGHSQAVRVKTFPDIVELGSVSVAVPQKRVILLMNPLSVPITLQCTIPDDGDETPLVLDLTDGLLPITVKDPYKQLLQEKQDLLAIDNSESEPDLFSESSSRNTYKSIGDDDENTSFSSEFEEQILVPIDDYASEILKNIKLKKIAEKVDAEKHIFIESLQCMMNTEYFSKLNQFKNFACMDWNSIPSDPKEIYCDSEIIYLKPNTGKNITLIVIPNKPGYHTRYVHIRICPINECLDYGESRTLVKSDIMVKKIWIEYNCRVPEIKYQNDIKFYSQTVYAGEEYRFDMLFTNLSNTGGFVYFDSVPKGADGIMRFTDGRWKFYVPPLDDVYAFCAVTFNRLGPTRLSGLIKTVGNPAGKPFHLIATVLPSRIQVWPKKIHLRTKVLESIRQYIFIENLTPTCTWLRFRLKTEGFQRIDPKGATLAPTGQWMYITLLSKFYDPGIYTNTLYISLQFGQLIEIPIKFNIEGMPIDFKPTIGEGGLNTGVILTSTFEEFEDNIPKYTREIQISNCGKRQYKLLLHKLKSSIHFCESLPQYAKITVTPKCTMLKPDCDEILTLAAVAWKPVTAYNEFRVELIDQEDKMRFYNMRFTASAIFIEPELTWTRRDICITYKRTHKFCDHPYIEVVQLCNINDVFIDSVCLKALGPFKIKASFEDDFCKEAEFPLVSLEKREITVLLDKAALQHKFCTKVEGRVSCMANSRYQRSLFLKVNIFNPELIISQPDLVLFTKYYESEAVVEVANVGCMDAQYLWRKLDETTHFIGPIQSENVYEYATEVLSEIFRMLELGDYDSEAENEENLTLRFQKYRCKLRQVHDSIGVRSIVLDIIENLDLEHKRYMITLDDESNISSQDSRPQTSKAVVKETLKSVLDRINLEDSYEVSESSMNACPEERQVYFYEKGGVLPEGQVAKCLLHLPPVRKGYEVQASFMLDVIGGLGRSFHLTLVNLEKTVEVPQSNIYLGIRPWYELFKTTFRLENVTNYKINIIARLNLRSALNQIIPKGRIANLSNGYVKITSDKRILIDENRLAKLKVEGILGFSDDFHRQILLTINDGEEINLRLRGQGVMPMLDVADKLPALVQDEIDIIREYNMLQRVYYFEIFKSITEIDEDFGVHEEEGVKDMFNEIMKYSQSTLQSTSSASTRTSARRFFRLIQSYVLVNNNEELPNAEVLQQLVQTEKFLENLSLNADTRFLLNMVYQDYLKLIKTHDELMPINLKYFTAQPLPFHMNGYILNMGQLKRNEFRKFKINLNFFGPGKLIAACRTVVKIPGLVVDFEIEESTTKETDTEFLYYVAEDKAPDLYDKPYRNMYERDMDLDTDPKLKHAHSFDYDVRAQHQRDLTAKDRKSIQNYYCSLNKSVYMSHKHQFVVCKIFSNSKRNFSGIIVRVIVIIKPERKFYKQGQLIEDFLYIDLHLGPTLPILLRGEII